MRRWKKLVVAPLVLVAGVEVLHLVAMNIALNSGIAPKVIAEQLDPIAVQLEYDRAITLFPGHMALTGLKLHGKDSKIEWWFSAEKSIGLVDPIAFFRRQYVAPWSKTKAAHLKIVTRPKKEPDPEIDPTKIWDVHLGGGSLELRDLQVDDVRFSGFAEIHGDFDLEPGRTVGFERSIVDVEDGDLFIGKSRVATNIRGRAEHHLPALALDKVGEALTDHLEGETAIDADVSSLWFLNRWLRGAPFVKFEAGHGHLRAKLITREGRFLPGSKLGMKAKGVRASLADLHAAATASVAWTVSKKNVSQLDVHLYEYSIRRKEDKKPYLFGDDLRLTARANDKLEPRSFFIDIPRARIPDIRTYQKYIPPGAHLRLEEGEGVLEGRIEIPERASAAEGRILISAQGIGASYKEQLRIRGDASFEAKLTSADLQRNKFNLDGSKLVLSNVAGTEIDQGWWSELVFTKADVDLSRKDALIRATGEVRAKNIRPLLVFYAVEASLPTFLQGLLDVENAFAIIELEAGEEIATIKRFELRGGGLKVEGVLRVEPERRRGAMRVEYYGIPVGFRIEGDHTSISVIGPSRPLQEEKRAIGVN